MPSLKSIAREVQDLKVAAGLRSAGATATDTLQAIRTDPALLMGGLEPDPSQLDLLRSKAKRMLLLCSRQAGKSRAAAALALQAALLDAPALVLLLSPTMRQSSELFRKVLEIFRTLGEPVGVQYQSVLRLELANGSRVAALPGADATVRGFSGVHTIVFDEAAQVDDSLYVTCRPMLSVSQGRLICLSTPFGCRGWFWREWVSDRAWERVRITAAECPRISPDFLEEERSVLGDRWFRQEYEVEFVDTDDQLIDTELIEASRDEVSTWGRVPTRRRCPSLRRTRCPARRGRTDSGRCRFATTTLATFTAGRSGRHIRRLWPMLTGSCGCQPRRATRWRAVHCALTKPAWELACTTSL